jgi:hypothetical protein
MRTCGTLFMSYISNTLHIGYVKHDAPRRLDFTDGMEDSGCMQVGRTQLTIVRTNLLKAGLILGG